jgi:hypothetical protein
LGWQDTGSYMGLDETYRPMGFHKRCKKTLGCEVGGILEMSLEELDRSFKRSLLARLDLLVAHVSSDGESMLASRVVY